MSLTREERIEAARARTQQNVENKNSFGVTGKQAINWEKIGGYKKERMYKPKAGMNNVDFIPYLVTTNKHPQKIKEGYPDYILDLWVHRFVGASKSTFICLEKMYGKSCPICEHREGMRNDPDVTDDDIKKLYPKRRCWYNVINLDLPEKDQEVQLFEESHFLFESKFLDVVNVKNEFSFWDIEDGKSIEFMATEKKSPQGSHMDYSQFFFQKRPAYKESIYEEAYKLDDLLYVPTYDEVKAAFLGLDEDEVSETKSEVRKDEPRREEPRERSRREEPKEESPFKENLPESFDQSPRQRERSRREEPQEVNKCPFGHKFGHDNEKYSAEGHCTQCDQKIWNECADEHDRIAKN
jgi:hypothetical protein